MCGSSWVHVQHKPLGWFIYNLLDVDKPWHDITIDLRKTYMYAVTKWIQV